MDISRLSEASEEDPLARLDALAENEAAELDRLVELILSFYDEWKEQ